MHTWKSHLRGVLFRLARTQHEKPLTDIQRTLCEVFDAQAITFCDANREPFSADLTLGELLSRPFSAEISVEMPPGRNGQRSDGNHRTDHPGDAPSRFQPEQVAPEQRIPWFIREFDRLEQTHEFMWAGYIVKEMLPRIGVATAEARQLLDELREEGIVVVEKIPNPKNPEHPASAVRLIRDHEQVKQVLANDATENTDS